MSRIRKALNTKQVHDERNPKKKVPNYLAPRVNRGEVSAGPFDAEQTWTIYKYSVDTPSKMTQQE